MYIVALLFGNNKADKDFKIVSNQTNGKKLYTINYTYPIKGNLIDKKAWYKKCKNHAKFYKNQGSAIKLVRRLEKDGYNVTGYKIIELEDDVVNNIYNGCPKCHSFEVIETFSTQYDRLLKFDPESNTSEQIGSTEDTGFGVIENYQCKNCGYDLSDFKFDHFNNKDINL